MLMIPRGARQMRFPTSWSLDSNGKDRTETSHQIEETKVVTDAIKDTNRVLNERTKGVKMT